MLRRKINCGFYLCERFQAGQIIITYAVDKIKEGTHLL